MKSFNLPDANVCYYPEFIKVDQANLYFQKLLHGLQWKSYPIKIFGKEYVQPRLVALYGDEGLEYSYSGTTLETLGWIKELDEIKEKIENIVETSFNTVLANLYRDGNDSNGWHADNEPSLGKNPIIASMSLGAPRKFKLKHIKNSKVNLDLLLEHGSLLVMAGTTQHYYKHQIPKTKKEVAERINLTYRTLIT